MNKMFVYLAGQWNEYENNWKEVLKKIQTYAFFDPETDSDQKTENFFNDDLSAIDKSDILIANPGSAPSEATWAEIGYFYHKNHQFPQKDQNLIIIWPEKRQPKWSMRFIEKMGIIVSTVEEAEKVLRNRIDR